MKNLFRPVKPMLLVSILPQESKTLFRVYRDYLVFINLVRELVNSHQHHIHGFSWLGSEAWLLIRPESEQLLAQVVSILKRYFLWLKQHDTGSEEFQLRVMELHTSEQMLDALRYVHKRPTTCGQVADPLDYHWHSYPVYNQFWQLDWLNTQELLGYFSSNRILAMNAFRQHMQRSGEHDYKAIIEQEPKSSYVDYNLVQNQALAEPEYPYHADITSYETQLVPIPSGLQVTFNTTS
ncbi:MAG: hypothetical protein HKP09_05115 [Enterobacterales bacterium]|nr:hypothetical protein [Enterobacterales bacterium]